jgi:hypothetical protein
LYSGVGISYILAEEVPESGSGTMDTNMWTSLLLLLLAVLRGAEGQGIYYPPLMGDKATGIFTFTCLKVLSSEMDPAEIRLIR